MEKTLILALLAGTMLFSHANADVVQGTWSFVGTDNCVIGGPFPNNDSGSPFVNTNYVANGGAQGFAVFNGDGTGTITLSVVAIWARYNTNGGTTIDHYSTYVINSAIPFTYAVTGDEFTLTETSNTGTFTSQQFETAGLTITGAPTVNGTISQNHPPILQTMTGTPAPELWNWGSIGIGPLSALCVRTRTYTKVNN